MATVVNRPKTRKMPGSQRPRRSHPGRVEAGRTGIDSARGVCLRMYLNGHYIEIMPDSPAGQFIQGRRRSELRTTQRRPAWRGESHASRSEEHTSELQSREKL